MSRPCPNRVGPWGPPCRLEMAHKGNCEPQLYPPEQRYAPRVKVPA